ncbi:hypothetical protein BJX63DRAFT_437375 [Aspergillus granulosus]|uniref:SAP domain-containing protein n=1 Tax=Aspergillus granulosus TaxID=176169 RepID=A0ABR4GVU8_9EURO
MRHPPPPYPNALDGEHGIFSHFPIHKIISMARQLEHDTAQPLHTQHRITIKVVENLNMKSRMLEIVFSDHALVNSIIKAGHLLEDVTQRLEHQARRISSNPVTAQVILSPVVDITDDPTPRKATPIAKNRDPAPIINRTDNPAQETSQPPRPALDILQPPSSVQSEPTIDRTDNPATETPQHSHPTLQSPIPVLSDPAIDHPHDRTPKTPQSSNHTKAASITAILNAEPSIPSSPSPMQDCLEDQESPHEYSQTSGGTFGLVNTSSDMCDDPLGTIPNAPVSVSESAVTSDPWQRESGELVGGHCIHLQRTPGTSIPQKRKHAAMKDTARSVSWRDLFHTSYSALDQTPEMKSVISLIALIRTLTTQDLKDILRTAGLQVKGAKAALQLRVIDYIEGLYQAGDQERYLSLRQFVYGTVGAPLPPSPPAPGHHYRQPSANQSLQFQQGPSAMEVSMHLTSKPRRSARLRY